MLVLSRKLNQSIIIGDDGEIEIVVVSVDRDQVKLGIKAPRHVPVHRSEVYLEIKRTNEAAAAGTGDAPRDSSDAGQPISSATLRPATVKRPATESAAPEATPS